MQVLLSCDHLRSLFKSHLGPFTPCVACVSCTSSTTQGGGGSFKNRKSIGRVGSSVVLCSCSCRCKCSCSCKLL